MKDLEVRVGPNGDATNFTTNPLCGAAFPGPAVKDKVSILKLIFGDCSVKLYHFVIGYSSQNDLALGTVTLKSVASN